MKNRYIPISRSAQNLEYIFNIYKSNQFISKRFLENLIIIIVLILDDRIRMTYFKNIIRHVE